MSAIPITQIYDYLASVFGKETAGKLIHRQIANPVKWIVGFGITIVILFVSIALRT